MLSISGRSQALVPALVLLCALLTAGCSTQSTAQATSSPAALTPSPTPTVLAVPSPVPLPDLTGFMAAWVEGQGMVLTWDPFETDFSCALERRDATDGEFVKLTDIDGAAGTVTDPDPGDSGTTPVYRLRIADGDRTTTSAEAGCQIPFLFGNTGGNLQNDGILCSRGDARYTLGVVDGTVGLCMQNNGGIRMLAPGMVSQINEMDGWVYYLTYPNGLLLRVKADGTGEPEPLGRDGLLFLLVVNDTLYATLADSNALVRMDADGANRQALDEGPCYDLGGAGSLLYYTHTGRREFVTMDLVSGQTASFALAGRGFAQILGGTVYFQNEEDGRRLYACSLDGSGPRLLLDQAVTGVNVSEAGIYVVYRDAGRRPYLVPFDGGEPRRLADLRVETISLSGDEVYLVGSDNSFYHIDTAGTLTKLG